MRAFDPFFYGKRNFDQVLNEALGGLPENADKHAPSSGSCRVPAPSAPDRMDQPLEGQRTLADWLWKQDQEPGIPREDPILVAPVAADIATGRLIILEPFTPTVKALSAACALPPFLQR